MLSEPDAQRFRAQQTRYWNDAAAGWTAWIEWTERNFSPLTAWFADRGCWAPGTRVLDVACGAGYPALTAAARVRAAQPFFVDGLLVLTAMSLCASGRKV